MAVYSGPWVKLGEGKGLVRWTLWTWHYTEEVQHRVSLLAFMYEETSVFLFLPSLHHLIQCLLTFEGLNGGVWVPVQYLGHKDIFKETIKTHFIAY